LTSGSEKDLLTMMNKHAILLVALMACLAPASSFADKIGDPAPPLTVKEWIKGKPVKIQPGTNIYVLVFATLSRANEFAITNLNSLQKIYQDKGVVVVAISDEPAEQVREFVQLKGAKIEYAVAADDVRKTTLNYLRVFQQIVLPRAFVVGKDGRVLWHGHPLRDGLGEVVDEITSGRYNLEQTQKSVAAREQMEQYLALARQDDAGSAKAGRRLLTLRTNDAAGLCELAFQIATDPLIEKRDVALAGEALDRAEKLSPTNTTRVAVNRAILLFQTGKEAEGLAQARKALASAQGQEAKDLAQANLRAMEVRLAAAKASQTNAPAGKP
jgi:AhpC/TSA family